MHIITLGTVQKGGIDSVIQGYIDNGLFDNKKHTRIGSHEGKSKWHDLYLFITATFKLIYLCLKDKQVILHCHMSYKGSFFRKLFFVVIAKVFKHKTIIHLHGSEFKDYYVASSDFKKTLILWLINSVDEFVVLSDSWQEFIDRIAVRKVMVINNYVDIEKYDVARIPGQILFLGAFIKRKGIYDLIHALKQISSDCHLHLCGAGEDEAVQKLIDELSLNDSVTNHGWVNAKQKTQLLSECSVFILPSYNEGLPMVIIEAMACEIPIISTPVGGIPEVIIEGETGYLVDPGDIGSISTKLSAVLDNNSDSQVTDKAKEYYNAHFSSKKILPKWEALYSRILID
ncbi:MAG: glycosyltransferase involved in cell wall biosynthesis [Oleispira sp.]|jgi:glycosyltransferase involved in cell wall biosynthesis|uniref:glycosyltransferase family 4 protein n=1 Tax=Psychromonas sp. TaxID=1884585 RepID=UPI0039E33AB4